MSAQQRVDFVIGEDGPNVRMEREGSRDVDDLNLDTQTPNGEGTFYRAANRGILATGDATGLDLYGPGTTEVNVTTPDNIEASSGSGINGMGEICRKSSIHRQMSSCNRNEHANKGDRGDNASIINYE